MTKAFRNALAGRLAPGPVSQPIAGRADMVRNHTGGYTFATSDEGRLVRFLVLGTDGPTFYQAESVRTAQNLAFVTRMAEADGLAMVRVIEDVNDNHRAPKHEATLLALAAVAKLGSPEARRAAWAIFPKVVRTGTHLFHILEYLKAFGGWGRSTREGVAGWYTSKTPEALALQAIKYGARDGWSHADALRKAHPRAEGALNAVLKFMVDGELADGAPEILRGYERLRQATGDAGAASLMREYALPMEAVPTEVRGPQVYRAAMETNGLTWLFRNLGNLARHGLLTPLSETAAGVAARVTDAGALRRGRIHPVDALKAMLVYGSGSGVRGSHSWTVNPQVTAALEKAFYLAFGAVEPANKRTLLGLDVSGSMTVGEVSGVPGFTPNMAAAAVAMVALRTEPQVHTLGFGTRLVDLGIGPRDALATAMTKAQRSFGTTNPGALFEWALAERVPVDTFVVYTDNEVNGGRHPAELLARYRRLSGLPARLIVVGLTATRFTLADPADGGMLDVVGLDSAAPAVMSAFSRGDF